MINASFKKAFSLAELLVVIAILTVLSGMAYIAVSQVREKSDNRRMMSDLLAIANALETYQREHQGLYPVPYITPGGMGGQQVLCFDASATFTDDCTTAAFVQGQMDETILNTRYLSQIPADPRTGSRYAYGVSQDGRYFMAAGNYKNGDVWEARTVGNTGKGYHLPSLIRAYDGPNFVTDKGQNLPYSPDHLALTATLENVNGSITVQRDGKPLSDLGAPLYAGDVIDAANGSADLYFSDGSVTRMIVGTKLTLSTLTVEKNDTKGLVTKIRLLLTGGRLWNKVARLANGSQFDVEAAGSVAGVRGTEFGIEITGGGANVVLASGSLKKDGDEVAKSDETAIEAFYESYNKIPLNNNMAPRIVSVATGRTITVENLYKTFTPARPAQQFLVDRVVAVSGGSILASAPVDPGNKDTDHTLVLPADATAVQLYFEYQGSRSGLSQPSFDVTAATSLLAADLYATEPETITETGTGTTPPPTACPTLTANALWLTGNGTSIPDCAWECVSGYRKEGESCIKIPTLADVCVGTNRLFQNGECWILGAGSSESCDATCANATLKCATGDWNDTNFAACVTLASQLNPPITVPNTPANRRVLTETDPANAYAPFINTATSQCMNINPNKSVNCSINSTSATRPRVCKCEL